MSLLSKIFSKEEISRRDCLDTLCEIVEFVFGVKLLHSTLYPAQSSLQFKQTPFLQQNPWVKEEITDFLDQQEVKEALGFNPQKYDKPIKLKIGERGTHIIAEFATQFLNLAWISSYFFSDGDPEPYFINMGFEKEDYQKQLEMLTELRNNPEMLKLSRNLTITHEIAHIWQNYNKDTILTGHGVTDRIEVEVIRNLYNSGKVDLEMSVKMINFFEKYMNSNYNPYKLPNTKKIPQPQNEIDTYLKTHFKLK